MYRIRLASLTCLAIFLSFATTNCGGSRVDVVEDIPAVTTALSSVANEFEDMASAAERKNYLDANVPNLDENIVAELRLREKISSKVDSVQFHFGSAKNVLGERGDNGEWVNGYFHHRLVATTFASNEVVTVIVECLNGTDLMVVDNSPDQSMEYVGTRTPSETIVIQPGEGLAHHVSFLTAIDLADRFSLPLYRGKVFNEGKRIAPAEARMMEQETAWVQVTVLVYPGDRFDLTKMEFYPVPNRYRG